MFPEFTEEEESLLDDDEFTEALWLIHHQDVLQLKAKVEDAFLGFRLRQRAQTEDMWWQCEPRALSCG